MYFLCRIPLQLRKMPTFLFLNFIIVVPRTLSSQQAQCAKLDIQKNFCEHDLCETSPKTF